VSPYQDAGGKKSSWEQRGVSAQKNPFSPAPPEGEGGGGVGGAWKGTKGHTGEHDLGGGNTKAKENKPIHALGGQSRGVWSTGAAET